MDLDHLIEEVVAFRQLQHLFRQGAQDTFRNGSLRGGFPFYFAIFLQGKFEPSTARALERHVKPGFVVFDIGANIGAHTLHIGHLVGQQGHVYAFEPTQYAFGKLSRNISLNPDIVPIVAASQIMLADSDSEELEPMIYSSWPLDDAGEDLHGVHRAKPMSTDGASVMSLDQFVTAQKIERLDVIKIDVDGHECSIFAGAQKTLADFKPTIIMELAPYVLEEAGTSLAQLLGLLENHGYALYDEVSEASLPQDKDMLEKLIPKGGSRNVIAISKS